VLIFSGGEPLFRHDLYELAKYAHGKGLFCALSTNGTLIDDERVKKIQASGFSYVGISLDGKREKHDEFRGKSGAFASALGAIQRCRDAGIKVGLRFSLTSLTASQLPFIFHLFERENLTKLYISHMNYLDRALSPLALEPTKTRQVMGFVVQKALAYLKDTEFSREIVSGNNEADAPFLILSLRREDPELANRLLRVLSRDRANAPAVRLVNIDPWGNLHPDPFCKNILLGNLRDSSLAQIMANNTNPLIELARKRHNPMNGRCGYCRFIDLCGGNSRSRAFAQSGDWWGSDPQCYLNDEEVYTTERPSIIHPRRHEEPESIGCLSMR
jgi:radical SAM protein with 4Fe4S-binding SPASM domain